MTKRTATYRLCIALLLCLVQTAGIALHGQNRPRAASKRAHTEQAADTARTITITIDTLARRMEKPEIKPLHTLTALTPDSLAADSIAAENQKKLQEIHSAPVIKEAPLPADSLGKGLRKTQWVPDPVKATWLALVIPGGGQIYNRKFWKLPIFYGGFAGCAYALTWNTKTYNDYSDAYKDAVNENWDSSSITDLLPPGYLEVVSKSQLTETLRKRKDTYRRYRDLSIFAFIGVYLLSVIDAYVDAELSNFDISPDLSMRVEPAVINNSPTQYTPTREKAVGVQCSFRF